MKINVDMTNEFLLSIAWLSEQWLDRASSVQNNTNQ